MKLATLIQGPLVVCFRHCSFEVEVSLLLSLPSSRSAAFPRPIIAEIVDSRFPMLSA